MPIVSWQLVDQQIFTGEVMSPSTPEDKILRNSHDFPGNSQCLRGWTGRYNPSGACKHSRMSYYRAIDCGKQTWTFGPQFNNRCGASAPPEQSARQCQDSASWGAIVRPGKCYILQWLCGYCSSRFGQSINLCSGRIKIIANPTAFTGNTRNSRRYSQCWSFPANYRQQCPRGVVHSVE